MAFDPASAAIVQLAWERRLGFDDGAFRPGVRLSKEINSGAASFVQLFGAAALLGPGWFLDRAAGLSNEELMQHTTLLGLGVDHGGRGLGAAELLFADDLAVIDPEEEVTVSLAAPDLKRLCTLCPVDDVNESGLTESTEHFTIVLDDGPVAAAGYQEWQGLLAHLGVLVAQESRRKGLGLIAAGIASHEALGTGLIPQWRAALGNTSAKALALKLGFVAAGTQTSILLPA